PPYLRDIHGIAKLKGGVAGDDEERVIARQLGYDVFRDTVAEVLLFRIAAHIGEGQYGDRRPSAGPQSLGSPTLGPDPGDPEGVNRDRDVLELLLAEIVAGQGEPMLHLVMHLRRNADAAGLGESFK